jgi:hypothetical protein
MALFISGHAVFGIAADSVALRLCMEECADPTSTSKDPLDPKSDPLDPGGGALPPGSHGEARRALNRLADGISAGKPTKLGELQVPTLFLFLLFILPKLLLYCYYYCMIIIPLLCHL